jgi:hypothetical protein
MNISREQFLAECKPRFGTANPERMRIAYWEWMVRSQMDPYYIRESLGLESTYTSAKSSPEGHEWVGDPDWCCKARFGMSYTAMADGRIICIGGEYEDSGWPDFCIYNDVIVMRPAPGEKWVTPDSGDVEIYGYPRDVFPPTDAHAAVLVGSKIYIIGSWGYSGTRTRGTTPVRTLDTGSYRIETVLATGQGPGWIYGHHASYDSGRHAITVRGGLVDENDDEEAVRNYAVYRLNLEDHRWELATARERRRKFVLDRADEGWWEWDEAALRPRSIPHTPILMRNLIVERAAIDVDGVRVNFEEGSNLNIEIEGELPQDTTERLLAELIASLSARTGAEWRCIETDGESPYWDTFPRS